VRLCALHTSRGSHNRQSGSTIEMKLPNLFEKDAVPSPYAAGQVIFAEGQNRDFMYVIKQGEVDIVIRGHVVETVGEDGFFGELALIDRAPRSAAAIAKTDCLLIKIDERQFVYLVQETPFFALIVMRTMAARIRRRNAQTIP
jgi:CRP/FNR family transcriptional regulator, cyclic AMP receptor protein